MSREPRPSSDGDSGSDHLHIYEDIDAPPRLPPASGVLHFHQDKVIIKPVAFKPVVGSSVLSPRLPPTAATPPGQRRLLSSIHTSPYSSADSATPGNGGHYSGNFPLDDRSANSSPAPVSKISQPRRSYSYPSEYGDTPSPPSGGYAELLREKDAEINYLRETLEHNEQVIFKVYAEKEQGWRRELAKARGHFEAKLRALQQQLAKAENLQTFQLSQDNRKLKLDLEEQQKYKASKDLQIENLQKQLSTLETQLEETEWSLCEKVGEISLLKAQLKDCQSDNTVKTTELLSLKAQLKEARASLEEKNANIEDLKEKLLQSQQELTFSKHHLERVIQGLQTQYEDSVVDLEAKNKALLQQKKEVELLRTELHSAHKELKACKEQFEEERCKWLVEKDKVIQYQKHLQLNYVHMYHRNRCLRNEVESLSLELNKDGKSHCGESHC